MNELQRRVARLVGEATGSERFAIGGGAGLAAHNIIDRPSNDIDVFVPKLDSAAFQRAETALCARLHDDGLSAEVTGRDDWFRGIRVTNPATGEVAVVDLNYDHRAHPPVTIGRIGPVLDAEDLVAGKL